MQPADALGGVEIGERAMAADELGTFEALKTCRREVVDPAIAEHGRRIVKPPETACWSSLPAQWMP
jgi:hypothetical protein